MAVDVTLNTTSGGLVPWPGVELHVHSENSWAEGGMELDPHWREVDGNGHGHFAVGQNLPTLRWVSRPCTVGHGDDCQSEGDWACAVCGLVVVPKKREMQPTLVESVRTYRLVHHSTNGVRTTYVFGEREWNSLVEAVDDTIEEMLSRFAVQTELRG